MAGHGPAPKDPARRQRRNQPKPALAVVQAQVMTQIGDIPELGAPVRPETEEAWRDLWEDPLSAAYVPTDLPALRRLFALYDERARAYEGYSNERLMPGSQGQPVLNPLFKVVQACDAEIRQLEDRFGLSPTARTRLGIAMGEAKKTLDDLNRELKADAPADPRLESK